MDQNQTTPSEEIIEGKESKFSWKRVIKYVFIGMLIFALGFGAFTAATARTTRIWYAYNFLGKTEHYLDCYGMPFYAQVLSVKEKHPEVSENIKKIGATITDVRVECSQWEDSMVFAKGDFLITYTDKKQKEELEKLLGKDIYGVAYRIEPAQ